MLERRQEGQLGAITTGSMRVRALSVHCVGPTSQSSRGTTFGHVKCPNTLMRDLPGYQDVLRANCSLRAGPKPEIWDFQCYMPVKC